MTDLLEHLPQMAGSLHAQVTGSQKRSFLICMFKSSAVTVMNSQSTLWIAQKCKFKVKILLKC